ncbi:MAG TPA: 50S ribosomal protein L9 [Dehalococcoidia bacterium]|nr:50S ribosomal protein L9 [Dehalococcoidia bacterium]
MRVVFLEHVDGVASAGEIKNVSDGYARNYLLPRKLAAAATASTMQQAESRAKKLAVEQEKVDIGARAIAEKLSASPFVLKAKVGQEGRLFGSITASDIAEAVNARGGAVEHRQVQLAQPIKEVGTYEIGVNLTRNVRAQVTVEVASDAAVPEAEAPVAEAPEAEAPVAEAPVAAKKAARDEDDASEKDDSEKE